MTIILVLLWVLAGLATATLIVTALVFTLRKKKSEKLWVSSGISAVLFIFLFFGMIFSIPSSDDQSSEIASSNESGGEPIQTEIGKEAERERSLEEEREENTEEVEETEEKTEESTNETVAAEESEADELEEEIEEPTDDSFDPADYQTGIEMAELERRPDDFIGQKFMYEGKIVQVMEDEPYTAYRVAVNDDYDRIAYIQMFSSTLEQRYLKDDYITFYGHYEGLLNYETVIGGEQTVPSFTVNGSHIEIAQ
ncbi:hypothetical protein [Salinicoccus halodurans]|uniref:TcdA-E operon negative regulator n=1 Tax=Salinicoccus halodurans TaxID=407035 RepID=A0AA94HIG5_9STAP|nr:hypothetical protein [Salinicoccus halodurans]SFK95615.1 hypothetical protein SAMN05216235_2765 [Salinicoccus halodurans]